MIPTTPTSTPEYFTGDENDREWHVWDAAKQIAAGIFSADTDVPTGAMTWQEFVVEKARELIAELERTQQEASDG